MKKLIIFALIMCLVGSQSCQKSREEMPALCMKTASMTSFGEFIGIRHNLYLDKIYDKLLTTGFKPDNYETTKANFLSVIDGFIDEFCGDFENKAVLIHHPMKYFDYFLNPNKSTENILFDLISESNLSQESKAILFTINELFSDDAISDAALVAGIDKAISMVIDTVHSPIEQGILLGTLNTGKSSALYWNSQGENWGSLLGVGYQKRWWRRIVRGDIEGGLAGGLAGAIIGGTTTLGTMTVPSWVAGAVVTGTISSAVAALGNLLDWIGL